MFVNLLPCHINNLSDCYIVFKICRRLYLKLVYLQHQNSQDVSEECRTLYDGSFMQNKTVVNFLSWYTGIATYKWNFQTKGQNWQCSYNTISFLIIDYVFDHMHYIIQDQLLCGLDIYDWCLMVNTGRLVKK